MKPGRTSPFFLLFVSLISNAQEPGTARHEGGKAVPEVAAKNAGAAVKAQPCQDAIRKMEERCRVERGPFEEEQKFVDQIAPLLEACDFTELSAEKAAIGQAMRWQAARTKPGWKAETDGPSQFHALIRNIERELLSRNATASASTAADSVEKRAKDFTQRPYQIALKELASQMRQTRAELSPAAATLLETIPVFDATQKMPLTNVCSTVAKRNSEFLVDPRMAVLTVFQAAALSQPPVPEQHIYDAVKAPHLSAGLIQLTRFAADRDPEGMHSAALTALLEPFVRQRLPADGYTAADIYGGPGIHQAFAMGMGNHALESAGRRERQRGIPARALISTKLSGQSSIEVVITGKCETGEKGTAVPKAGVAKNFTAPDGSKSVAITPFETTSDWDYVIEEDGKTTDHKNGFYDRRSITYDPSTHSTRFVIRLPQKELDGGDRIVTYGLDTRCDGRERVIPFDVPIRRGLDTKAFEKQITGCASPDFKAFDADGIRRGIVVTGPLIHPLSAQVSFLADLDFTCSKAIEVETKVEFLRLLAGREKSQVDYVIRNAHANGSEQNHLLARLGADNPETLFINGK